MAYVAGDTIKATEYNTFVNSSSDPFGYNHFAGTGSGVYGLGQTEIATVSGGDTTITAAQFNSLITGLINIGNHTNASITARTAVETGDTIKIKAAVVADLATIAAAIASGSPSATALTDNSLRTVTTGSAGWDNTATHETSVTFANADKMRHYFNAGGKIRCNIGIAATTNGDKDQAYADLGTALGNLDIGATTTLRSGSGETETSFATSTGFHDLGTTYTSLIKLTSDNSNYTDNNVEIFAKLNAAVGTAVTITVKFVWTDGANDTVFDSPNTSGVPADNKTTPRVTSTVIERHPNNSEGLSAAIQSSSNAEVTNATT